MNKRGSITVLFAILMPIILLMGMFMFECLWEQTALSYFDQACYASARGTLADYQKDAWMDYGLLVLDDQARITHRAKTLFEGNLDGRDWMPISLTRLEIRPVVPLDQDVMRHQILETVKYVAPLRGALALRDILESFRLSESFSSAGKVALDLEQAQDNMDRTTLNNKRIKQDKSSIRETRKKIAQEKNEEEPDTSRIARLERSIQAKQRRVDDLYEENQRLSYETRDILDRCSCEHVPEKVDEQNMENRALTRELEGLQKAAKRTKELTGWQDQTDSRIFSFGRTDKRVAGKALSLLQQAKTVFNQGRDRFYLGEYVLKYLPDVHDEADSEVEYIITGSSRPALAYTLRLLATRVSLDALGFFALDPKAPPEILSRVAYALIMGGLQGAVDVYQLVGQNESVPLVHITPPSYQLLEKIKLSYEDHLRFDLLITSDAKKMDRIEEIVDVQGYTGVEWVCEASVPKIFPLFSRLDPASSSEYMVLHKELRVCY